MPLSKFVVSLLIVVGFAMQATDANACRVPIQQVDPLHQQYDASAFATVTTVSEGVAQINVGRRLWGSPPVGQVELVFDYDAAGNIDENSIVVSGCGPGGPRLALHELVVVYFRNGTIVRWAHAAQMVMRDPHVQAAFLNAHSEIGRKLKRDQSRRADEVVHFKGPVPRSDPAQWVKPFDGSLGWVFPSAAYSTFKFQVEHDGRIANCRAGGGATKDPEISDKVCKMLVKNASFKRPRLTHERTGIFVIRWHETTTTPESSDTGER